MSQPLRESLEAIVDDTYECMVATIAADRKMKDYRVRTLLDEGLFTAPAAKKAGLVDHVIYADQLEDLLRKRLKAEKLEVSPTTRGRNSIPISPVSAGWPS